VRASGAGDTGDEIVDEAGDSGASIMQGNPFRGGPALIVILTKRMQSPQHGLTNGTAAAALGFQAGGPDGRPRGGATETVPRPAIDGLDYGLRLGAAAVGGELGPVSQCPGVQQFHGPGLRPSGSQCPTTKLEFRTVAGAGADRRLGQTPDTVGHARIHHLVDHEAVRPDLAAGELGRPAGELVRLMLLLNFGGPPRCRLGRHRWCRTIF
jgi:hypothetical protein